MLTTFCSKCLRYCRPGVVDFVTRVQTEECPKCQRQFIRGEPATEVIFWADKRFKISTGPVTKPLRSDDSRLRGLVDELVKRGTNYGDSMDE